MNEVIRVVEKAKSVQEVLGDECFKIDVDALNRAVSSAVYGRRFTRYLLLKLDYLFGDSMQRMSVDFLSVEHVLPQNPADNSQWKKDFTDDMRNEWTHRIGNLVLITTKKNTSQGRLDFSEKKNRYFEKRITTCSNSLRVLKNAQWTQIELERNHNEVLAKLRQYYGIN